MTQRVLLVGEPPAATAVKRHLVDDHGCSVTMVKANEYKHVPDGTTWVLVMNGEKRGPVIFTEARKAGAEAISIPPSWSHAKDKLTKLGFFRAPEPAAGKQRPFADLREAMERRKQEEIAEAARKAQAAIERAAAEIERAEHEAEAQETVTALTPGGPSIMESFDAADAAVAGPESFRGEDFPVTEREEPKAPAPEPPPPAPLAMTEPKDRYAARMEKLRATRGEKIAWLWELFDRNPDLSLDDANVILAATGPDRRGIAFDTISEVRDEVRTLKGLHTEVRVRSRLARSVGIAPVYGTSERPVYEPVVLAGSAAGTPPPAEAPAPADPPPPAAPTPGVLPSEVETAARLLKEALIAAPVASFKLTYEKGGKARVSWLPILTPVDTDL